jgi:hypothetical protein
MCSPNPYLVGQTYLVSPRLYDGKLHDGGCFQGRNVDGDEEVRQVLDHFHGKTSTNIHGKVAVAREYDLVDFLLGMGEARSLAGAQVVASNGRNQVSTVTDANGAYNLALPFSGKFTLRTFLSPYIAREPSLELTAPSNGGCMERDLAFKIDNTISGRVWGSAGQPLEGAQVGLIDLDHPSSGEFSHAWFMKEYSEKDRMFRFENVPIGRYLLVFNPDGPKSGSLFDLALESTYYPLGSDRAHAQIIEINRSGVHLSGMDLLVGQQVKFREITVHVRFTEGAPMKTAQIICVGLPRSTEDSAWTNWQVVSKDGTVKFLAPANRKLRIEAKDSYGRKLKTSYSAEYAAGDSKIDRTFIVVE